MPKVVDHDERRRMIAEAVRRIAADRGLEAVSLGEVAVEAGISKGLVQHYFATKDEMLRYATTALRRQVERRIPDGPPALREVLVAMLPVDAEARTEALVANAFLPRALKDPAIGTRFREGHGELVALLTTLVAAAQEAGGIDPELDAEPEAETLLALVGGLGDAVLLGHRSPAHAESLIDRHLARLAPAG
ncbi:TetR family transcriptional regulator [Saccharomonospora sp. CUA-673]|uniref:TetR/AcrR family transcriptional regulator n=1 Tax=Saccharomonospora sp. CUA-673 TaxID=1904969 RepID=UPI000962C0B4|nr:TetR/AcrR family transcriptional regulator [Saccharomonospora sp. CUA-673]OLT45292.1 TetR family transcriptional regulator [Saccharomonospora sp. CUA-673]